MSESDSSLTVHERPPQLHLPFGLSFHDSFNANGNYSLLNGVSEAPLDESECFEQSSKSVYVNETTLRIPRKPIPSQSSSSPSHLYPSSATTPLSATSPSNALLPKPRRAAIADIHWLIPISAVLCFTIGVALAIGHYAYLRALDEETVSNQVWIGRYSLAMAFLVRAFLSAAITTAFTQRVWHSLQRSKNGMSMFGIDALFSADYSPIHLVSWDMWRHALIPALMATSIWLMPLIQVLAPTALTFGTSQNIQEDAHCLVPTLNITHLPEVDQGSLSLFDINYEGLSFLPSTTARYLVDLTAQGGRQVGWDSPCGSNCTYDIAFVAPAWTCNRTDQVNPSENSWPEQWFEGYGDGSNYSASDPDLNLQYSPIYQAHYNNQTTQLWVGATDRVNLAVPNDVSGYMSAKDFLNLHLYICSIAWIDYRLQVVYTNHQQVNNIVELSYRGKVEIPSSIWGGNVEEGDVDNAAVLGVASLYSPLIGLLSGSIDRYPQEGLVSSTAIGSVPQLVRIYEGYMGSGQQDPYIPILALGPRLEELSRNVSISLLSQPKLDTTTTVATTCTTYTTITVWKFRPTPLVTAYLCAVCVATVALVLGGHSIFSAGVARDRSFSSIVRSTRNSELDALYARDPGSIALPSSQQLRKRRLRFSSDGMAYGMSDSREKRMSFRPVEESGGEMIEGKMMPGVDNELQTSPDSSTR